MKVAIGVITYQRPEVLHRLLEAIPRLDPLPAACVLDRVIVVDNDAGGSAAATVRTARNMTDVPLVYEVEPEPGISSARNRVVALADGCDSLAFIDDDEVPAPGWLRGLVGVMVATGADLVAGPTLSVVPDSAPTWMRDGNLFDRPRRPTGASFVFAGSGNLLIDLAQTVRLRPLFDVRYGLLGGSDTHLFLRARAAGMRMVWCDEAETYEALPADRAALRWILRRAFRGGNTVGLCERELSAGRRRVVAILNRVAKATVRLFQGLAEGAVGAARARPDLAAGGLRRGVNALGMIAGLCGVKYVEYRRAQEKGIRR